MRVDLCEVCGKNKFNGFHSRPDAIECAHIGHKIIGESMRKHLIKEQEATTDNKAPMHAEIKEIREWHKLCGMYLNRPKELQVKRLHELSDKWMPIDTTQMLFDYIDKLQSRLEKCEETLKLIRGYAYTMGEGNIIAERINEYFA